MSAPVDSEVDVQRLMDQIRAAVAERESSGNRSLIGASVELRKMLSRQREAARQLTSLPSELPAREYSQPAPVSLQPAFVPKKNDRYHTSDLLPYHDHTFVWHAYRAILKREPDEEGLRQFLTKLRSGRFNKIDVLAALSASPEGRSKNVRVDGLRFPALVRKLYRVPVVGYMLETVVGIVRLPVLLSSQRQFEGHVLTQLEVLANQINQQSKTGFQVAESFSRELEHVWKEHGRLAEMVPEEVRKVSEEQRTFAELQHQQVVGLFREQRQIVEGLKKLREEIETSNRNQQGRNERRLPDHEPARLDELFASLTEHLRGTSAEIKEGLKFYLPFLKAAGVSGNILDLGCGRGEWLELLKENDLQARGVESNTVMTAQARSKGLEVVEADALTYLRSLPDQILNAVTGFHFIEHVPFEALIELLDEILRTLRPGGLVVFETPNPKNLVVGACNFYSDPTHLKPLFPETVAFILSNRGFANVKIEYVNAVADSPFTADGETSRVLDSWFYSARDFAVIARKD